MSRPAVGPTQPPVQRVDCVWNVMTHAQKPYFVFRRNGWVHLNRQGSQFSRLLAAEVCASAVVMLDTPCSEVEWRVLATHSIRQFPLHFPSRASPCAITFQRDSTVSMGIKRRASRKWWHVEVTYCSRCPMLHYFISISSCASHIAESWGLYYTLLNCSHTEPEIRTELQHESLKMEENFVKAPSALIGWLCCCGCQRTVRRRTKLDSFCPGYGPVAGMCGRGNESSCSIKAWEFIDPPCSRWALKGLSAWSYAVVSAEFCGPPLQ